MIFNSYDLLTYEIQPWLQNLLVWNINKNKMQWFSSSLWLIFNIIQYKDEIFTI